MVLSLRDKGRYGKLKANSNIGEIVVDISIYGWGEKIELVKDGKTILCIDTCNCITEDSYDDEDEDYYAQDYVAVCLEDKDKIHISDFDDYHTEIILNYPHLR